MLPRWQQALQRPGVGVPSKDVGAGAGQLSLEDLGDVVVQIGGSADRGVAPSLGHQRRSVPSVAASPKSITTAEVQSTSRRLSSQAAAVKITTAVLALQLSMATVSTTAGSAFATHPHPLNTTSR